MKPKILVLMAFILALASRVWAADIQRVTGADWLLMSAEEKTAVLKESMEFLTKKGLPLRRPPAFYGQAITLLVDQPGSQKAYVMNLLTSVIYKDDPRSRPMIDKMKAKPAKAPAAKKDVQRQVI